MRLQPGGQLARPDTARDQRRPRSSSVRGASVAITGAWSEGRSSLRGALSMTQAPAGRRKRRRQQDVVDAQAAIEAEAHLPVIPPRVELGRLLEQAEGIGQAEVDKLAEGGALRFAAQDLVLPRHRVMHVAILRRDVVVAQQRQSREALQFAAQMVASAASQRSLYSYLSEPTSCPLGM
jgi:hypothetical protein